MKMTAKWHLIRWRLVKLQTTWKNNRNEKEIPLLCLCLRYDTDTLTWLIFGCKRTQAERQCEESARQMPRSARKIDSDGRDTRIAPWDQSVCENVGDLPAKVEAVVSTFFVPGYVCDKDEGKRNCRKRSVQWCTCTHYSLKCISVCSARFNNQQTFRVCQINQTLKEREKADLMTAKWAK